MKGTIALDIDGTVTTSHRSIPAEVVESLSKLAEIGWEIIFVTGRPFFHCVQVLQAIDFPFYLAPQNGAALVRMPDRSLLMKRYLPRSVIPVMDEICESEETDYVIYSGLENHDCVFFRRHGFASNMRQYLARRTREFAEDWQSVASFDQVPLTEFASVKCFAVAGVAERLAKSIEERLQLHVPVISDPFDADYRVIQGTHQECHKGQVVADLRKIQQSLDKPLIAAGDDFNDISMLKSADHAIVMGTASQEVRALATSIAAPAAEQGIIPALEKAVAEI